MPHHDDILHVHNIKIKTNRGSLSKKLLDNIFIYNLIDAKRTCYRGECLSLGVLPQTLYGQ